MGGLRRWAGSAQSTSPSRQSKISVPDTRGSARPAPPRTQVLPSSSGSISTPRLPCTAIRGRYLILLGGGFTVGLSPIVHGWSRTGTQQEIRGDPPPLLD
ncbi:hypothetical protein ACFRFL_03035 [Streptomyces sp. NPDC056708]|uniref:hypothetical protein n=1 Tax=unclassified Streptomyces TaxID=2593676 RepID=UPI00369B69E4